MILRKLQDVETMDVGKAFGFPEGMQLIQWIISNEVGDERYHHSYAVRKYTIKPGVDLEKMPFHNHEYVQSPYILSGRMIFENNQGEKVEAGPGDTVFFYENEPHRGTVLGNETVELLCIIDCPGNGENCVPEYPKNIAK